MSSAEINTLLEVQIVIDADSSSGNEFSVTCPRAGTIVDVLCTATASAAGGFFNIFTTQGATLTVDAITNDAVTRQTAFGGSLPVNRTMRVGDTFQVRASSDAGGANTRGVITILLAAPGATLS